MKILLVKTSALGDLVHIFPVVSYLRDRFPAATIDWVVEKRFSELVHAHPEINKVIEVDTKNLRKSFAPTRKQLRETKYDLLFDLQGNIKSGLITAFARVDKKVGFGLKTSAEWPNTLFTDVRFNPPKGENIRHDYLFVVRSVFNDQKLFDVPYTFLNISKEEEKRAQELTPKKPCSVMLCPGSAWPNKQMDERSLIEMVQQLEEETFVYLIWGSNKEKALVERLHTHFPTTSTILPRLPIPTLQSAMRRMDLVISMDSFPLHLAAESGVTTYSIFGPTSAAKYAPLGPRHETSQGPCPYGQTFEKRCPHLRTCKNAPCIKH